MKVYLDNAATTPLDEEVLNEMIPWMRDNFGNPSSIHAYGRKSRSGIETARKSVAKFLNVSPSEIFFTSGGTEADNMAIVQCINDHQISHAVTTLIEHHAVLHTLEVLEKKGIIKLSYVRTDSHGNVDLEHLDELLSSNPRSFVSLMHANNEIGTLLDLEATGKICEKYSAIFHSDTVQTMGHYALDLKKINVHFVTCAAHKFHGPKGVGFLYISNKVQISPFINGGAQERNMRGGTENLYGIIGLAKAFEICHRDLHEHQQHIREIKNRMTNLILEKIPGTEINGEKGDKSLYTVLNVLLPPTSGAEMLLFNLDISGVAASGGSACSSGSNVGSHVLRALGKDMSRPAVRFSFSKYNTSDEIDFAVAKLCEFVTPTKATV
jgi:cysteine desulfurase